MRKLTKLEEPFELHEMKAYWQKKVAENGSNYYKTKYRARPIKKRLKGETSNKCIYCESKIGHNTPGDVEHKIPVSIYEEGRFKWKNLTIACTECNRRKNDYYNEDTRFIDPYTDEVETMLIHVGPVVFNKPGNERAEISVRILELAEIESRPELFAQKVSRLKSAKNLMERIVSVQNPTLKSLLLEELHSMADISSEFSAMIKTLIEKIDR
jgi:hypothetical protein